MQFNVAQQEIVLRVVYVGPPQAGKRTNLREIHKLLDPRSCGRLREIPLAEDRAPCFDLTPLAVRSSHGYRIKFKLVVVPGTLQQVANRRVLLAGADGLLFVAHSDPAEQARNVASWHEVQAALRATGADPEAVAAIWQYNKQDLRGAVPPDALPPHLASPPPRVGATALEGDGVAEALHALLEAMFDRLDQRYNLRAKFDIEVEDLLETIFASALPLLFASRRPSVVSLQ